MLASSAHERPASLIAILLGALAFAPARAESVDEGSFKVYRFDEPLGAETFAITLGHDSLAVMARQYLTLPTSNGGSRSSGMPTCW